MEYRNKNSSPNNTHFHLLIGITAMHLFLALSLAIFTLATIGCVVWAMITEDPISFIFVLVGGVCILLLLIATFLTSKLGKQCLFGPHVDPSPTDSDGNDSLSAVDSA